MMKSITIGVFTLLSSAFLTAQTTTIDFESTVLTPESFNNGSDLSGGFTYNGVHFGNFYDPSFSFFTGFAISNRTDVSTPGFTNQFSAYTGGGFNSSNFAVFYPGNAIDLSSSPRVLESMRISNSTFAALSMKNGDSFAKKFGSINNANGVQDGTNGEDFLKLTIYATNLSGDTIGNLPVFLADFRFADSTLDYILDDWTLVDLSSLNSPIESVAYLQFEFESSDVGSFGINTPTYFVLDDFIFSDGFLAIDDKKDVDSWRLFPNPVQDVLTISNVQGEILIHSLAGELILSLYVDNSASISTSELNSGAYLVTVISETGTSMKRFMKL